VKRKLFSLQYKILILTIIITVIPLAILGMVSSGVSLRILEEQVSQSNFNTNQQIADKINIVFANLDDYTMKLWRDETFIGALQNANESPMSVGVQRLAVQKVVSSYQVFEDNIYSAYIEGNNGLVYDTAGLKNNISPELKEKLFELRGGGILIADEVQDYRGVTKRVFSFLRVLKNPDILTEDLGIIKINILEKTITDTYKGMILGDSSQMYIVEQDSLILSALDESNIGERLPENFFDDAKANNSQGFFVRGEGREKEVVTYVAIDYADWKLVNTIPMRELNQSAALIQRMTIMSIVISILLCLLISVFISSRILKPLKTLRQFMSSIDGEHFDIVIPETGNDEITLLSISFNKMLKKLKELVQEVYIMEIKQREMEISILQEQINPHFLYNALNTIYWNCRVEHAEQSAELVKKLSLLFRLSLNSGEIITTVEKEVEHLNCYLAIQEKRFEGLVTFIVDVEKDALKSKAIKLVIQPLVENALIHGIEKKENAGIIKISVYHKENILYYVIEDDGAGVDIKEIEKLLKAPEEENRGFAIKNVNDRIQIHYTQEYGLFYESEIGKGTKVTVKQPFDVEESK